MELEPGQQAWEERGGPRQQALQVSPPESRACQWQGRQVSLRELLGRAWSLTEPIRRGWPSRRQESRGDPPSVSTHLPAATQRAIWFLPALLRAGKPRARSA